MRFLAQILMSVLRFTNERFFIPLAQWCAKKLIDPTPAPQVVAGAYVEADQRITPLILMAALDDHAKFLESRPADCQSVLNACMESMRTESLRGVFLGMLGELSATYPLEESLTRVLANAVFLGMHLEKRVQVL